MPDFPLEIEVRFTIRRENGKFYVDQNRQAETTVVPSFGTLDQALDYISKSVRRVIDLHRPLGG